MKKENLRIFFYFCDYPFEARPKADFCIVSRIFSILLLFTSRQTSLTLFAVPFPPKTNTDAIVNAAAALVQTDGMSALSMRTLALRLGVRASSLYRHFPDRAAIENAIAKRAAHQLLDLMNASVELTDGEKALFNAAKAYLDFANANTALYRLMMAADDAVTKPIADLLLRLVSNATSSPDDDAGSTAFWSFLHGFVALEQAGHLGASPSKLTFVRGTQALVRGLSVAHSTATALHR